MASNEKLGSPRQSWRDSPQGREEPWYRGWGEAALELGPALTVLPLAAFVAIYVLSGSS